MKHQKATPLTLRDTHLDPPPAREVDPRDKPIEFELSPLERERAAHGMDAARARIQRANAAAEASDV